MPDPTFQNQAFTSMPLTHPAVQAPQPGQGPGAGMHPLMQMIMQMFGGQGGQQGQQGQQGNQAGGMHPLLQMLLQHFMGQFGRRGDQDGMGGGMTGSPGMMPPRRLPPQQAPGQNVNTGGIAGAPTVRSMPIGGANPGSTPFMSPLMNMMLNPQTQGMVR